MGPNTPFEFTKFGGLDLPNVRNGDSSRPRTRGQYVGLDVLDFRDITLTMDVGPPFATYSTLEGALSALRAVTNTQGTTEYPLWLQMPNLGLLVTMCRCRKRNIDVDIAFSAGSLAQNISLQFHATDPYWYSSPTQDPSAGLPGPAGGFTFPLSFPLTFGAGVSPNTLTAVNAGDAPCYPQLVITGPCLEPAISNTSMPGVPSLTFDIQLFAGDELVIDLDLQSAMYYPAGSTVGQTALATLLPNSNWWALLPGTNIIAFDSSNPALDTGTLTVNWASAFSSVV